MEQSPFVIGIVRSAESSLTRQKKMASTGCISVEAISSCKTTVGREPHRATVILHASRAGVNFQECAQRSLAIHNVDRFALPVYDNKALGLTLQHLPHRRR